MNLSPLDQFENDIVVCRKCPRLVAWREQVGTIKRRAFRDQSYWAKPVPGFGDADAQVMVVGLAPGAHGSNRTGRMFTGDDSGKFLYPALWRAGFASQPEGSDPQDDLRLKNMWITAVCRCVPPDNKPTRDEIVNCHPFLEGELARLPDLRVIVALGRIAWDEVVRFGDLARGVVVPPFAHGSKFHSESMKLWVVASYHPSRQNTQTGRLSPKMFDEIWNTANQLLMS